MGKDHAIGVVLKWAMDDGIIQYTKQYDYSGGYWYEFSVL